MSEFGKGYNLEYLDKINKFENSLSKNTRARLRDKLRETKALAALLAKPRKKRTKDENEKINNYFNNLQTVTRVSLLGDTPTHKSMENIGTEYHQAAKLTEASKVYSEARLRGESHTNAKAQTEAYLQDKQLGHPDLKGWEMDGDLTKEFGGRQNNYRGAVFHNPSENQTRVSFRGTKFGTTNFGLEDLALDADIVKNGVVPNHPQVREANLLTKKAIEKYGRSGTKTTGYSLGGFKGINAGNENNIGSITFNPLTQGDALLNDSVPQEDSIHKIIKTVDDVPSLNSGSLKAKYAEEGNYDISTLGSHDDLKIKQGWKIPFTDYDTGISAENLKEYGEHSHKMSNFVEDHRSRLNDTTGLY